MNLTREQALTLHRQMWTDMQKDLGDRPGGNSRDWYKRQWIKKHFPDEDIIGNCFLCEYCNSCHRCPVVWPAEPEGYCCTGDLNYTTLPISELLALPEREVEE